MRYDQRNMLAHSFVSLIAKHAFGGAIPTGYYTAQRFADDRIVGCVYDGCKPGMVSFGVHSFRNITRYFRCTDYIAFVIRNWRNGNRNGDELPAFRQPVGLKV